MRKCRRTACTSGLAVTHIHTMAGDRYCQFCARKINDANPEHPRLVIPIPTLAQLMALDSFKFQGSEYSLESDSLGYKLYRDGKRYKEYAIRAGVAEDIIGDIFGPGT